MGTSNDKATDHAREFIGSVLRITAEHGMRSGDSKDAYDKAVAGAARQATALERQIKRMIIGRER
jgi:hypothetical protein